MTKPTTLFLSIVLIFLNFFYASSQQYYDYGFKRDNSIIVKNMKGDTLDMAWVGGLNSVHFQEIDINQDGIRDLVCFDVQGNRLLTFINGGTPNKVDYTYQPQYELDFPEILSWLQTVDYDNDGDMDLFTYSTYGAGISVYKNVSSNGKLKFQMVTRTINYSIPGWPPTNIFVSSVDYPGLVDVDHDGDLDILTFSVLGTFVYWYKNYSMENYNVPDSLDFKLADKCWGKFAESENTNSVILNQYCPYSKSASKPLGYEKSPLKHTGSTLLPIDLNNDSLYDLILGDVDYFTLNALINGGTPDSAHMISQDTMFPSYNQHVDIITFPVINYIDIDNDGVKELVTAPFEGAYYKPENSNCVWMYDNSGTNNLPNFSLNTRSFIQGEMIDVGDAAHPVLVDVNGDGLEDMIVANYGYVDSSYLDTNWYILHTFKISHLSYFKNIGSPGHPTYELVDTNWANLDTLERISLSPTFGDLDNDGDMDMILGCDQGDLFYCMNTAGAGNTISFSGAVPHYQNITVGDDNFSTPQLIDIDGDTLLDLVIGKKTNRLRKVNMQDSIVGYISYYRNTGSKTNPIFQLETDSMGNVDPKNYWNYYAAYSVPYFFRDNNDSLKLFVGSASGLVFYYRDIENNIHGSFGLDSNLVYIDVVDTLYSVFSYEDHYKTLRPFKSGIYSAPLVNDFDNDGYPDLMIGNFSGGINYFKGIAPPGVGIDNPKQEIFADVKLYPNPAGDYFNLKIDKYQNLREFQMEIRDINGRLIRRGNYSSAPLIRINTEGLNKGVYFVRIQARNSMRQDFVRTLKLIIM